MDILNQGTYSGNFFSFQNPMFLAITVMLLSVGSVGVVFLKVIIPLQRRYILQKQKALLEKAELMALFAEMDPDPLIRINDDGIIIHTNAASREIFPWIEKKRTNINTVIPDLKEHTNYGETETIEKVEDKYFAVLARREEKANFTNIYLHDITQIKIYEKDLENYKNKLKSFAGKLDTENENLKKTLASELHDDIGQLLISLKLKSSGITSDKQDEFESDIETIYQKVRTLSHNLRPVEITRHGLDISLKSLVQKITDNANISGTFDYYGSPQRFTSEIEFCIYRTIQEAITNIIKHANATEFSIQVQNADKAIIVNISDNGIGIQSDYFTSKQYFGAGTGLFSMKERIENLNGDIKICSIPGEGTTLFIQIPKG